MTSTQIALALLALVAIVATLRLVLVRPRGWIALLLLQPSWIACTAWLLFVPKPPADSASVIVVTPGATAEQLTAARARATAGERVYRFAGDADAPRAAVRGDRRSQHEATLPRSDADRRDAAIPTAPDLATLLRNESVASLHVIGGGLSLRDREALSQLESLPPIQFDAAPAPAGLVAMTAPRTAAPGRRIAVTGRASGVVDARIEWLAPGDVVLDAAPVADEGSFALATQVKVPGLLRSTVRLLDAKGAPIESWPVVIDVVPAAALRALVIGGGANAELKYLRRFLVDAGFAIDGRVAISRGIAVADGQPRIDVATLDASDVAIIDERGWANLRASDRTLLVEAVDRGLGLILRATSLPADGTRAEWRELGFDLRSEDVPRSVNLLRARGLRDAPGVRATHDRVPLAIDADDAVPLLAADDGTPLAIARNHGRGRIALTWITDSYRAVLDGDPTQYGAIWSPIVEAVLRPKDVATPIDVPAYGFLGERVTICGVDENAAVRNDVAAEGEADAARLLVDATCAGFWPRVPGLHHVTSNDRNATSHVFAPDEAHAFRADETRRATQALVGGTPPQATATPPRIAREWLALLWLLLGAACWFVERRARTSLNAGSAA